MSISRLAVLGVIVCSAFAIAFAATQSAEDKELLKLREWMSGSFSSTIQAQSDTSYFDIRLEMTPIWTSRTDGCWLYVEQATAAKLDRPYRQRVYRLSRINETTIQSEVFTLQEPLRFAGAWKEPKKFNPFTPDSLSKKDGCAIILRLSGDTAFVGSTVGRECPSDLRGAVYATSEVVITSTYLFSWDRGFDSTRVQVWGATKGGYRFIKSKPSR
jgi:hypothetical protein